MNDYEGAMDDWYNFVSDTKMDYGVDMSILTRPFSEEQRKYYLQVRLRFGNASFLSFLFFCNCYFSYYLLD